MLTGFVDDIRPDRIVGWAADPDSPNARVELAISVDQHEVGRVVADLDRDDLKRLGRFGDGRHGFLFPLPTKLSNTEDHDVSVNFVETDRVLAKFKFFRRNPDAQHDSLASLNSSGAAPRYVVHIGQPKTGTKYLQQAFMRFRKQLLEDGICYPTEWWESSELFAHHQLVHELEGGPPKKLEEAFQELNASKHRIILLSCEGFCENSEAGLSNLHRLIAGRPVDIIYFARRWSDIIPSQWQQNVKQGRCETFAEFYADILARAENSQIVNQKVTLDRFAKIFGRNSLKVISYSNLQDRREDIAAGFFRNVLGWRHDLILKQDLVHESMGTTLTELIRCLNILRVSKEGKSDFQTHEALRAIQDSPNILEDLRFLYATMEKYLDRITVDDNAQSFKEIFAAMNEAYRDRMLFQEYGRDFFAKKRRAFVFVRPEFLLDDGAVRALRRIHTAVDGKISETRAEAAQ